MRKIYATTFPILFTFLVFAQNQQDDISNTQNLKSKTANGISTINGTVTPKSATLFVPSNSNRDKIKENHNAPSGEYIEGKLFFKIIPSTKIELPLYDAKTASDIIPQYPEDFTNIMTTYQINKLSRPFIRTKSTNLLNTYEIEFPTSVSIDALIRDLEKIGFIEYAEKVPMYHTNLTPNDPQFSSQYYLPLINAESAWDISTGSSAIKVAVLDNAFRISHEDLASNIWTNSAEIAGDSIDNDGNGYIDDVNGFDAANNDPDVGHTLMSNSKWTHGTHVAGLVSAASNNSTGIASMGYNVSLIPVKITDDAANYRTITASYEGMLYAIAVDADVVSMSFGGPTFSQSIQNLIDYGKDQGVLWIAAAGNDNISTQSYPAANDNVIAVAASDATDKKASFSNYGSWVDVTTPGTAILSTKAGADNSYGNLQGTSMATPITSGLAALMKSHFPAITVSQLDSCLVNTTVNIDALNTTRCAGGPCAGKLGSGRIDALAAMNCISSLLLEKPKANFKSNLTSTLTGVGINFTDLSTFAPTGWTWSFPGGTPSSSSLQNPTGISYATTGMKDVQLIVTNPNGSDTLLKTNYINISPTPTCDSINWWLGTSGTFFDNDLGPGVDYPFGYPNALVSSTASAEIVPSALYGSTDHLLSVSFGLLGAKASSPTSKIIATIWDNTGPGGTPGAVIRTEDILLQEIEDALSMAPPGSYVLKTVDFGLSVGNPYILPTGNDFYVGIDFSSAVSGDEVTLLTSGIGSTIPSTLFFKDNGTTWTSADALGAGLQTSSSSFIRVGTAPTANFSFLDPTTGCSGMSVELDNTSTNSVFYNWSLPGGSPSFSASPELTVRYDVSGTYDVILYARGTCSDVLSKTQSNAIQVYDFTVNEVITPETCDNDTIGDGAIDLTVSGDNPPFNYTWSNGDTTEDLSGLRAGAYQVAINDAFGCSEFITYDVPLDGITITITPTASTNGSDGSLIANATGGTGPYIYAWSTGDTSFILPGLGADTFTVTVTDAAGCTDVATGIVTGVVAQGINNLPNSNQLSIYPNPTTGNISLIYEIQGNNLPKIEVFDLLGQSIQFNISNNSTSGKINLSFDETVRDGLYLVKVSTTTTRLVKKIKLVRD